MEMVKKHMIAILSILSVVLLALPLANLEFSMEVFGQVTESSSTINGFNALGKSVFAYLLIIGPVLLIAMNYVKQLEPYKGILAIAVPIVCLVALIIVLISAKSFSASSSNDYASAEVKIKLGIGAILVALSYIGTIIAGAVTYHDFTLDKAGLEKLKSNAADLLGTAQERVSNVMQNTPKETRSNNATSADAISIEHPTKSAHKKPVNLSRVDEILEIIEKLSKMKDTGVLTEQEYNEKKQQLLEEIQ